MKHIVLIQLGSPESPKVSSVRNFLKKFLKDERVVDINPWLWRIILYLFILPFRPQKVLNNYKRIWCHKRHEFGSPLFIHSENLRNKLAEFFPSSQYQVKLVYLLNKPTLDDYFNEDFTNIERVVFIPLFPQFCEGTTMSVLDQLGSALKKAIKTPPFEVMTSFHLVEAFLERSAQRLAEVVGFYDRSGYPIDAILLSFHGLPTRRVLYKKDPYFDQCLETFIGIRKFLPDNLKSKLQLSFQSRFGSEEWLAPSTEEKVVSLISENKKNIVVYCPSFVTDCLESLDEIGIELAHFAQERGGNLFLASCLNDDTKWCQKFAQHLMANDKKLVQIDKQELKMVHEQNPQKVASPPLTPMAKSSIKIVFLTLFLDLIGFSIIFPLFPSLAKHYLEVDGQNFFLKGIFDSINYLFPSKVGDSFTPIVLFGGILGALYSFLQFLCAPFWGTLSDKIGRRPVLLFCVGGLALSYVLWFFSGSFTMLIIARLIGGIMGGNISTASAVVADVTTESNRSKGMAFIGIAFALGFILGPALGGISSLIDLTKIYPDWANYGVNPFSMPALIAALLSLFNFFYLWKSFKETLPEKKIGSHDIVRSINPLKLFRVLPYPGVNKTNIGYFLFLLAFSGMEFTLTFLAVERLGFTSLQNGYMFIYIGLILTLVQGGYVRRKAHQVGEAKMALQGLVFVLPGLLIIGWANSVFLLYLGLFFLAVGSSLIIPCLTTLASLYAPKESQGEVLGTFRSLGALARVIGPIAASLIYWRSGSSYPYLIGSIFLLLPIYLVATLPKPKLNNVN